MDLDRGLVSRLLDEGETAYAALSEAGIDPGWLYGDWSRALRFVLEHRQTYGALPTKAAVEMRLGVQFNGQETDPASFFIVEVRQRRLFNLLKEGAESFVAALSAAPKDPTAALSALEATIARTRLEKLGVSKVVSIFELIPQVIDRYERMKRGEHGILLPWQPLNRMTTGLWPEDVAVFVARTGIGKCLDEATEIVDPVTGDVRTLREVYEDGGFQKVLTWSKDRGIHVAPITAKVDTGRKRCLRFTFASGRSVVVTPEHPFLTPEGWAAAESLSAGASVALPARAPFPEEPTSLPAHEVDLLAVLLAEGGTTEKSIARFSTASAEILDIVREAARPLGCVVKYRRAYDYDLIGTVAGKNRALDLVRAHGLSEKRSKEKVVPKAIFRLPSGQLRRFLGVFWMCDGYVDKTGPGVTLASEALVRQIQHLLLRFGVQSSVDYKVARTGGKKFDSWRLRVYAQSWEAFAHACPLWGKKAAKLGEILSLRRNSNVGFPTVSDAFKHRVREIADTRSGRWKGGALSLVGERLGWTSWFSLKCLYKGKSLSLNSFRAFCEVYGCVDEFRWLWDSDLFWDRVEKIEDAGVRKIYDLTVAPTACFVANDVVVHNTQALVVCAADAFRQGKKVLFVSTEMAGVRIAARYFAFDCKVPYQDLRSGTLSGFAEPLFMGEIQRRVGATGFWLVGGGFDVDMRSIEAAVGECKPDIVFVDGMYLVKGRGDDRYEEASNAVHDIKRLAKRLQLPFVLSTQFNRSVKQNATKGSLESISLSDVIGWDSDWVFGLFQDDDLRANRRMKIATLKAREGDPVEVEANWNWDSQDFSEAVGMSGSTPHDPDFDNVPV